MDSFLDVFYHKRNASLRKDIKDYIEELALPEEAIFYLIVQHSILRLAKVIGYRHELLRFFRQLSQGAISLERIELEA